MNLAAYVEKFLQAPNVLMIFNDQINF